MKYIKTDTILLPFKSVTHVTFSKVINMTTKKEYQITKFWFNANGKSDCVTLENADGFNALNEYEDYLENCNE